MSDIPTLIYRGNFEVTARIDYAGALLSAEYGNGYREDAVVGIPLRSWALTYSALNRRVNVQPQDAEPIDRLNYIWNFVTSSKDNGNALFKLRCPRDGKLYLAYFPEDILELTLVDRYLATTGLQIKQRNVRGINTLSDGSIADEIVNPDVI
jgi:hypothetical protein